MAGGYPVADNLPFHSIANEHWLLSKLFSLLFGEPYILNFSYSGLLFAILFIIPICVMPEMEMP